MPDQSLLLYTRRYLARDYLLGPQPSTHCRLPPIDPITDIRDPFSFSPSDDLDQSFLPEINYTEKLILEHETAVYLSSIITAPDEGKNLLLEDLRWSTKYRIEEPLVKEQRRRQVHRVSKEVFEEWPVGSCGDSGITWDRDVRRGVWEHVREVEAEKMVIGPVVLGFLQDIHRPRTPPSTAEVIEEKVGYCKTVTSRHMTPPLLPLSPVIPPPPKLVEVLDLQPIDAGETALLIADLTAPFIAADSIPTGSSPDSHLNFLQINPSTPSPIRKCPRPETLMVEALLTPPTSAVKKVHFVDLGLPPRISTPEHEVVEDHLDGKQILVRVSQELEQEQLQEADSTLRVEIPIMDFSMPKLPWEGVGNGVEKLRDLKAWAGVAARNWGGSASVGVDLSWRPFVKSAIKVPVEGLGSEEVLNGIVVLPGEGDDSEKILMDGLKTLGLKTHSEDEETELESGDFTLKMDIEALLKRRRKRKGPRTEKPMRTIVTEGEVETRKNPRLETSIFANTLDTFMELRSRVAKKPAIPSASASRTIQINPGPETVQKPIPQTHSTATPETKTFPTPNLHLPDSPGTFIASTTLLAQRRLFRLIKDFYPTAKIIERDFSVPIIDTFADTAPNYNDTAEADLILSPLSSILITTLQRIRQIPMPNQSLNTVRQRVMSVAHLYDRLFVIILGTPRASDIETIAGFTGFAAGLRAGVQVRVLKEDDKVVAKWIVALMIREGEEVRLLEEETLWERFLRKVGFNAFAAQVVLRSCREGGLRAFLKMEAGEKKRAFEMVVGERVLGRVLARLEGEWDV